MLLTKICQEGIDIFNFLFLKYCSIFILNKDFFKIMCDAFRVIYLKILTLLIKHMNSLTVFTQASSQHKIIMHQLNLNLN